MAVLNSIFGDIGTNEKLQFMIDSRLEKFNKPWYKELFPFAAPQLSLSYVSVIGETTIAAAASVVSRDAETPLRSRDALQKLYGEIPAIKVMRKLNESHYRDYMSLQDLSNVSDEVKKTQAFKLVWDDVNYVTTAVDKRLDFFVAQGLSTGKIEITAENNPDGVVSDEIDLFVPGDNKGQATISWANAATATPLKDILLIVQTGEAQGFSYEKILMDVSLYQKFLATKEVREIVGSYFGLSPAARNSGTAPITQDRVNEYLQASKLPVIEVVNIKVPIQKNGVNTMMNPWNINNAVFIPSGNLGEIKNAIAVEEQRAVEKVVYAKKDYTLISKWAQNEPFGEWTKAEFNAFPSFTALNQSYIFTAVA